MFAVARGLAGIPSVAREVGVWHARALAIPDGPLREDALHCLEHKRDHIEGAALFWVLTPRRDRGLLRLLIAFQTIWDFLDDASERCCTAENSRQLHLALSDALDPSAPISDYYRFHPYKRDGGYLRALVESCRAGCLALPSYPQVRAQMLTHTALCEVQSLNHIADPGHRDRALQAWVAPLHRREPALEWFELAAAASGFTPHVLLALAAEESCGQDEVTATLECYFPWFSLALTMLDSYNDWRRDLTDGAHSYISHYESPDQAVARLCEIVATATQRAGSSPLGRRHAVLVACMVAMHLSRTSAWTSEMRPRTRAIATSAGSLARLLLPLARVWRASYLAHADAKRS